MSATSRHEAGYRCASYDKDFHSRAMEFTSSAGWLFPFKIYMIDPSNDVCVFLHASFDTACIYILRLVLWTVLHMDVDSFGHFAPDCSSWGIPSRGTSLRNFINAAGNVCNSWVKGANLQVSRNLSSYIRDIA